MVGVNRKLIAGSVWVCYMTLYSDKCIQELHCKCARCINVVQQATCVQMVDWWMWLVIIKEAQWTAG